MCTHHLEGLIVVLENYIPVRTWGNSGGEFLISVSSFPSKTSTKTLKMYNTVCIIMGQ